MRKMKTPFTLFVGLLIMLLITKSYTQPFTFVHITDAHVSEGLLGSIGNNDSDGEQFNCNMQWFYNLNPKPAFIVVSGDVSNMGSKGPDGMYGVLTQYLYPQGGITDPANGAFFIDSAQTIPVYFVSGNHEHYVAIVPPIQESTLTYYPENLAPDVDYTVAYNDALILFLRSGKDRPIWQDNSFAAVESEGITAAQCQWLRSTLQAAGGLGYNRKIIVMHHPVMNRAGTNYDGTINGESYAGLTDGSFLYNRETFMNICDSNNVDVVLAGHVHQNVVLDTAGNVVTENYPNGTRYCQTAQSFMGAYRVITVNSNFVSVGYPSVVNCLTVGAERLANTSFEIYPNPFCSITTLEISENSEFSNYELRIYDVMGREVKNVTDIHKGKNTIDKGNLTSGIYFYTLSNSKGISGSGKFIIKD